MHLSRRLRRSLLPIEPPAPSGEAVPTPWPTPFWPETAAWAQPAADAELSALPSGDLPLPVPTPAGVAPQPTPVASEAPVVVEALPEAPTLEAQAAADAAPVAFPLDVVSVELPSTGGEVRLGALPLTLAAQAGSFDQAVTIQAVPLAAASAAQLSPGGGGTGLPAVTYGTVMKANRWDSGGSVSPMIMPRIGQITTELGGVVTFTYGQSHACTTSGSGYIRHPYDSAPSWYFNNPDDPSAGGGRGLFNKWMVTAMTQADTFSGNDTQTYNYSYSTPTWHYSDEPTLGDINSCTLCQTRHWNEFRGSEVVTVTDGSGAKTEYRFLRGMNGDRLTTLTYPGNNTGGLGEGVNRNYNPLGQLDQVISAADSIHFVASTLYLPTGQAWRQRLDQSTNGVDRYFTYQSGTLRLNEQKAGTASPWTDRQQLTYGYDAAGNVSSLTDGQNQTTGISQVQSFGYDWLDRLVTASTNAAGTGQYNHTYGYNAIGNLTSYAGSSYTYGSSKPHAVTSAFGFSYAYDANGNLTNRTVSGVTYTFVYDHENRLTEMKQGTTVLASFVYDAEGNRVKGTANSVTTVYLDGIYEYRAGAVTRYYAGHTGLVAMRKTGYGGSSDGVFYILSDQLQSTSRILNQNNTVAATHYYYPYGGNRTGAAYSTLTAKRFTGQYQEMDLPGGGLYYYGARWYDARIARFASADTIVPDAGNPQDLNRYSYVRNNPVKYFRS